MRSIPHCQLAIQIFVAGRSINTERPWLQNLSDSVSLQQMGWNGVRCTAELEIGVRFIPWDEHICVPYTLTMCLRGVNKGHCTCMHQRQIICGIQQTPQGVCQQGSQSCRTGGCWPIGEQSGGQTNGPLFLGQRTGRNENNYLGFGCTMHVCRDITVSCVHSRTTNLTEGALTRPVKFSYLQGWAHWWFFCLLPSCGTQLWYDHDPVSGGWRCAAHVSVSSLMLGYLFCCTHQRLSSVML